MQRPLQLLQQQLPQQAMRPLQPELRGRTQETRAHGSQVESLCLMMDDFVFLLVKGERER